LRVCERSLQVLGGIGFTAEHDHHRYHSRVLALNAIAGSTAELTRSLGADLRAGTIDATPTRAPLLGTADA
ncbi:MAG: hypothetical protein KDB21_07010, partial [Acidimicrobiales bacterium]|nr:hypothetical protein [Acidimicrobiales bacterium]